MLRIRPSIPRKRLTFLKTIIRVKGDLLVLVGETDNSIRATGALVGSKIEGVFVRSDYQGRGYGKTIMAELEKIAKAKGLTETGLSISVTSKKFYESLGYEVLPERTIDVGEGQSLKYWPGKKSLKSACK
jgi:ribosomal protein S18 acetylase RimI-like enzyme